MIVDTSAVLAVLFREADAAHYARPLLFKGKDFTRTDVAQA